jgi:hypothetical protein
MSIPETEIAWAAGFFDGEGHVGEHGHGIVINIAQKQLEPLYRFRKAVGCRAMIGHHANDAWQINIGGLREVVAVLDTLWPYLCEPKRQQALRAGFIPPNRKIPDRNSDSS